MVCDLFTSLMFTSAILYSLVRHQLPDNVIQAADMI